MKKIIISLIIVLFLSPCSQAEEAVKDNADNSKNNNPVVNTQKIDTSKNEILKDNSKEQKSKDVSQPKEDVKVQPKKNVKKTSTHKKEKVAPSKKEEKIKSENKKTEDKKALEEQKKAEKAKIDEILIKKGFLNKNKKSNLKVTYYDEIKYAFQKHYECSSKYDLEGLKELYADNYTNVDGFSKEVYFKLVEKTWKSYPNIKYKLKIKNIEIAQDFAVVHVEEQAIATTSSKTKEVKDIGTLESYADSIYYLERIGGKWLIISDTVLFEQTNLKYGSARFASTSLAAPTQVKAGSQYTATLKIVPPKDSFVVASIGRENITYPQSVAQEVFRKLPESNILERVFTANTKNINEYAVASYGITKAEIKNGKELKVYVTGLGFVMYRVNVIPKNNFVKVEDEKTK
ncbi:MAG: hypothetical protein MJ229_02570 [bacterium]|nr:hypothetical protein [bacterium]